MGHTEGNTMTINNVNSTLAQYESTTKARVDLEGQLALVVSRQSAEFGDVLTAIVDAMDGKDNIRTLADAAKKDGITLTTNGGRTPSKNWFDRHDAIGRFWQKASPAIGSDEAVALTEGLGNTGYPSPSTLRTTVENADDHNVVDKVRDLFREFAKAREDEKATADEGEGEGEATGEDEGKTTTDRDLVDAIANILKGWKGDGTATVDDLVATVKTVGVYA